MFLFTLHTPPLPPEHWDCRHARSHLVKLDALKEWLSWVEIPGYWSTDTVEMDPLFNRKEKRNTHWLSHTSDWKVHITVCGKRQLRWERHQITKSDTVLLSIYGESWIVSFGWEGRVDIKPWGRVQMPYRIASLGYLLRHVLCSEGSMYWHV